MEKNELFVCECSNVEHQLIFTYFDDETNGDVYMSVHLIPESNIWKRIKNAIKYIFGYRSKYGDFDEFIFRSKDSEKLQSIINYLKKSSVD